MAKKKKIASVVAEAFEIPKDISERQAKVTLLGRESVLIENHSGIISYSPGRIICQTEEGLLEIIGDNLLLDSLEADELFIQGIIIQVIFLPSESN